MKRYGLHVILVALATLFVSLVKQASNVPTTLDDRPCYVKGSAYAVNDPSEEPTCPAETEPQGTAIGSEL